MGTVNADVNELLQAQRNMQVAIASIESTKSEITKKYLQVGDSWKDKKYRELNDVVQECNKALNEILKILSKGEKYVDSLAKSLQDYEDTTLGETSSRRNTPGTVGGLQRPIEFNGNGIRSFISSAFDKDCDIYSALDGVEYNPIKLAPVARTEQQIIRSISGGDMTEGSCSSLALAYAGNRAGYVVYDFRNGQSREIFSLRSSIEFIANLSGVSSSILRGTDDTICAEQLMSNMEQGREYYLATGAHAAVVRLNNDGRYQYLELQSGVQGENGWHPLTLSTLYSRFGCEDGQHIEYANYLIELDSLQQNTEFLNLLGYINTDESEQMRGESGYVR